MHNINMLTSLKQNMLLFVTHIKCIIFTTSLKQNINMLHSHTNISSVPQNVSVSIIVAG